MRDIALEPDTSLLSGFDIRIKQVFTDRIYLKAKRELIDTIRKLPLFSPAPAALHKFRDGSLKQNEYAEGNLQISYAETVGGMVDIDADIDLYRNPLEHFFGEVLVNHLSGNKTD